MLWCDGLRDDHDVAHHKHKLCHREEGCEGDEDVRATKKLSSKRKKKMCPEEREDRVQSYMHELRETWWQLLLFLPHHLDIPQIKLEHVLLSSLNHV